ncbi:MAG: polyprenyl synthetase family protein [Spirochaetales bacterium]|nr:polyprenyl synthetase family protein [Spirochaetales bacterium]
MANIAAFNRKLDAIIREDLPVLKKVKKFVIQSGGKRIRPLLHYHTCALLEYQGKVWQDVGAIGELIHAASLLHDDVVDESKTRRGQPSTNALHGNKTAVLCGDYLLACGLDHLRTLPGSQELLRIFTVVIRKLAVGELLQLQWESNIRLDRKTYEQIIHCKTGALFGAMTESAALLAAHSSLKEYARFGEELGLLFQLRDDYLDYFPGKGDGKPAFQDFKRGLVTFPFLLLLEERKNRKELVRLFAMEDREAALEELMPFLTTRVQKTLAISIESKVHEAMHFVRRHPPLPARALLIDQLHALQV